MENLREKLQLAYELRKQGLSLKKIEQMTDINFRDLSVLFKYVDDINNLDLKDFEREKEALENNYKNLISELKDKNKKLQELLKESEKEKKDLAININTQKFNLKIIKPTTLLFLLIIFFAIGAGVGVYVTGDKTIKKFINLKQKENSLAIKEAELNAKERELKIQEKKFSEQVKQFNKILNSLGGGK
jgi:hypothetical protein